MNTTRRGFLANLAVAFAGALLPWKAQAMSTASICQPAPPPEHLYDAWHLTLSYNYDNEIMTCREIVGHVVFAKPQTMDAILARLPMPQRGFVRQMSFVEHDIIDHRKASFRIFDRQMA